MRHVNGRACVKPFWGCNKVQPRRLTSVALVMACTRKIWLRHTIVDAMATKMLETDNNSVTPGSVKQSAEMPNNLVANAPARPSLKRTAWLPPKEGELFPGATIAEVEDAKWNTHPTLVAEFHDIEKNFKNEFGKLGDFNETTPKKRGRPDDLGLTSPKVHNTDSESIPLEKAIGEVTCEAKTTPDGAIPGWFCYVPH